MSKFKLFQGFTLTELLVGILFSTITTSAVISGSIYVKKTLYNIVQKKKKKMKPALVETQKSLIYINQTISIISQ